MTTSNPTYTEQDFMEIEEQARSHSLNVKPGRQPNMVEVEFDDLKRLLYALDPRNRRCETLLDFGQLSAAVVSSPKDFNPERTQRS